MKQGKSLVELAQELTRRAEAKKDFIANTSVINMEPDTLRLSVSGVGSFDTDTLTHKQIGQWAEIPAKYYERMMEESPELLATNVNHWFAVSATRRLIRTLDGRARAFLSDRYRRIDNEQIAEAVLPVLMDAGNDIRIESCEVTDKKLYLKAVFPKIEGEVKKGDPVQSGVVISNSEVGLGSLSVQPLVYRLVCSNGLIANDSGMSRYHVGRKIGDGADVMALLRDETIAADDRALMMALQDVVRASLSQVSFDKLLAKMRAAAEGQTVKKPVEAVEVLSKTFGLRDGEKGSVLENLIRDGDYSRWGVLNAITRAANDVDSYDRATELEEFGGRILDLPAREWKVIAEAGVEEEMKMAA